MQHNTQSTINLLQHWRFVFFLFLLALMFVVVIRVFIRYYCFY